MTIPPNPVRFYIDGENFSISLLYSLRDNGEQSTYLNVDWVRLAQSFIRQQQNETLDKICYFSVQYKRGTTQATKQHAYHQALRKSGVEITYGQYKIKASECSQCGTLTNKKEEKETDVNIALRIALDAEDNAYSRAIVVSADTDLIPAIRAVKSRHPNKEILVATPPIAGKRSAHEFLRTADKVQSIKLARVQNYNLTI